MRYNRLGSTGLIVSELCLGAMTFGTDPGRFANIAGMDQDASTAMVNPLFRTEFTIHGMFCNILSTRREGTEMLTRRDANRSLARSASSRRSG